MWPESMARRRSWSAVESATWSIHRWNTRPRTSRRWSGSDAIASGQFFFSLVFRQLETALQVSGNSSSGIWKQLFRYLETVLQVSGNSSSDSWKKFFRQLETTLQTAWNNSSDSLKQLFRKLETAFQAAGNSCCWKVIFS